MHKYNKYQKYQGKHQGKAKYKRIDPKRKQQSLEQFYEIISEIENKTDMKNFLKDLLTPSESLMIARRIEIAMMLLQGASYDEVRETLGVGFSTISYVDKWINNGFDGYRKEVKKAQKRVADKKEKEEEFVNYLPYDELKNKYPGHFALVDLLVRKFRK